jgi:hypothetical protein
MSEDFIAASHLFGFLTISLDYFPLFGALGVILVLYLQARRWWDG